MSQDNRDSLCNSLFASTSLPDSFLAGTDATVRLVDLANASSLGGQAEQLRGRSVLIATTSQLAAALAMLELDGIARQLLLYPPDLPWDLVSFVVESLRLDAIVSDRPELQAEHNVTCFVASGPALSPADCDRTPSHQTEWILLTSGSSGRPKMVVHTLSSLAGGIERTDALAGGFVWSTFYDIRRYGGLQIFLRAILTGGSLVLSDAREPVARFLTRAGGYGVTHISGTPSHWRMAVMSPSANRIAPQYVRLSGEIADQGILDSLRSVYPNAKIAHAFASTEAGLAFDVRDGLAGFPASLIEKGCSGSVELKVEDGSLRVRSPRNASRYSGSHNGTLADTDGFVDTGDLLELRGNRYHFVGRRDGVINVGGLKVHPEEVETVINGHPRVRMSLVRKRKNPVTGAVVVADVALWTAAENGQALKLEHEILELCRSALPRHKVPAAISFRQDLPVSAAGKLVRPRA